MRSPHKSPDDLQRILNGIPEPVLVKDRKHRFVAMNDAFCKLLGRSQAELTGRTDHDFVPRPQADGYWAVDDEVFITGEESEIEERLTNPGGREYVLRTRKRRISVGEKGQERHLLVASIIDITRMRQIERRLRESERGIRALADDAPTIIWATDATGETIFFNRAWRETTGQSAHEAIAGGWITAIHPDDRQRVVDAFIAASARRSRFSAEYRLRRMDGEYIWVIDTGRPRKGEDGAFAGYVGSVLDISERKAAEEAHTESERSARALAARLSMVLESTMDSIVVLDKDWRLTYFNENARRALATRNPRLGVSLWEMFPEEEHGLFARHYRRALKEMQPVLFEEYLPAFDQWLEVNAYPTKEGLTIFYRDVTDRRQAERDRLHAQEQIAYLAGHDHLTGLINRQQLTDRLNDALAGRADDQLIAVHCLDLDGFKAINDSRGHPTGDMLLRLAGERIRNCVRGSDMVARIGGDEFVVVQAGPENREAAAGLAERLIEALSEPFQADGHILQIGTSIGIAIAPDDGLDSASLLKAADTALYTVKAEGGHTCRFYTEDMRALTETRYETITALREALGKREFVLHYQPLVNLATRRIASFEALLRWRHPQRGMVSPAEFIPLAEETGLIGAIGQWVLREACRQAATWPDSIHVAVNISPIQMKSMSLLDTVRSALRESGLAPSRLQLEITETALLQRDAPILELLQTLRQLGVSIAMDDFGTGYSSLSYLRSFPIDKIKLDRSFVDDLHDNAVAGTILRAVAGLGSGLGIAITAEGIETQEQLEAVQREGYAEGQGYLFSRPVAGDKVASLIEQSLAGPILAPNYRHVAAGRNPHTPGFPQ